MTSRFNSFDASGFNAFVDSGFNARGIAAVPAIFIAQRTGSGANTSGAVFAFTFDSATPLWSYTLDRFPSDMVVGEDRIFVSTLNTLYAIDKFTGSLIASFARTSIDAADRVTSFVGMTTSPAGSYVYTAGAMSSGAGDVKLYQFDRDLSLLTIGNTTSLGSDGSLVTPGLWPTIGHGLVTSASGATFARYTQLSLVTSTISGATYGASTDRMRAIYSTSFPVLVQPIPSGSLFVTDGVTNRTIANGSSICLQNSNYFVTNGGTVSSGSTVITRYDSSLGLIDAVTKAEFDAIDPGAPSSMETLRFARAIDGDVLIVGQSSDDFQSWWWWRLDAALTTLIAKGSFAIGVTFLNSPTRLLLNAPAGGIIPASGADWG